MPLGVSDDLGVIRKAIDEQASHRLQSAGRVSRRRGLRPAYRCLSGADEAALHWLQSSRPDAGPRQAVEQENPGLPPYPHAPFRGLRAGPPVKLRETAIPIRCWSSRPSRRPRWGSAANRLCTTSSSCGTELTIVHDELKTDALVEEYIEGREFYVGVVGNRRLQTFPVWEMIFKNLPDDVPNIATRRVKWDAAYQKQLGIDTQAAEGCRKPSRQADLQALQTGLSSPLA